MFQQLFIITLSLFITNAKADEVIRGKYLSQTMSCNDCHTPMYGPKLGQVPESQWLTGSPVGFKGPWGTSYPTNLRQRMQALTSDQWVTYVRNLQTRPPMPFYELKKATDADLKAIYTYVKSLGPSDNVIPPALPPNQHPKTPYIDFTVKGLPKGA